MSIVSCWNATSKRVKTGLPGVAWLKLDPQAQWPENLAAQGSGMIGDPPDATPVVAKLAGVRLRYRKAVALDGSICRCPQDALSG